MLLYIYFSKANVRTDIDHLGKVLPLLVSPSMFVSSLLNRSLMPMPHANQRVQVPTNANVGLDIQGMARPVNVSEALSFHPKMTPRVPI